MKYKGKRIPTSFPLSRLLLEYMPEHIFLIDRFCYFAGVSVKLMTTWCLFFASVSVCNVSDRSSLYRNASELRK